jgi:hypothetical protein
LRKRLGKILGSNKEQVTGDWQKLHNDKLHDLYFSPDTVELMKFKKDEIAGLSAYMGEKINA